MRYKAVIFDMDGTITHPVIDFPRIRREIGLPDGDLALEIAKLSAGEQKRAWAIIADCEQVAEKRQELQAGTKALLDRCRANDVCLGLITRNVQRSVNVLCRKFDLEFDAVITREFPHLKPHPAPILHMLKQWDIAPDDTLMVGDYVHDIECGKAAGTATSFYCNPHARDFGAHADFAVRSMAELEMHLL